MNYLEVPETIKLFIAALIKTCTLLLTSCIVRYQHAHEQLFGKSIHKRTKASVDTVVDAVGGTVSSEVDIEVPKSSTPPICTPNIPVAPPPPNPSSGGVEGDIVVATPNITVAPPPPNPSSGGVEGDIVVANTSIVVANTSSSRKTNTIEDMNRKFDRDLYFWNSTEHSYLGGGFTNPSMKKDKGDYDKWQIKRIDDQPDVVEEHDQVIIIRRNVAICHVATGKYLSCRRWFFVTNSALAEFRKNRDKFESFEMIYASDNSCIFKSHNDLFLSINQTFYTGAFKSCRNRDGDDGRPLQGRWNCNEAFARRGIKATPGRIIVKVAKTLWTGHNWFEAVEKILEYVISIDWFEAVEKILEHVGSILAELPLL